MTVSKFVKDQTVAFEQRLNVDIAEQKLSLPVITIAMEPGSGGCLIAEKVAKRLGFILYSKNILTAMSNKLDVKQSVFEAIEKERWSQLEDFFASLLPKGDYVYSGDYFQNLKETITNLGTIGKAVIVGRGANFILPPEKRFAVRVIAPREIRIRNVAFRFKVTVEEAEKRIANREAKRKSFIRKNFQQDIDDPMNYDLVINTARMGLETCAEMIIGALKGSQINRDFEKASSYILKTTR